MEELSATINKLKEYIYQAFKETRYPGDRNILHPECHDDMDVRSFYGRTDWRSVSDELVEYENAALCSFSAAAFQFFLPRYLVFALENLEGGAVSVDTTIYSLDPGLHGDELREFQESKYALLTPEQIGCIVAFLRLCVEALGDYVDADAAAKGLKYWEKRVKGG